MDLLEFLLEIQANVKSQMADGGLYPEEIFSDIMMDHMAEVGMTFEPFICPYKGTVNNANVRLTGYAMSEECNELDLFVSLYDGVDAITSVTDTETQAAAGQCLRFLALCAQGKMAEKLDPSRDIRSLAENLQQSYNELEQIRVFVLTDKVAKSKTFKTKEIGGKAVRIEVMDIERLHRHLSEGKPRDEIVVNFNEVSGTPLPCIYVPGDSEDYDYALAAIPGEALRLLYEKFGARLLEANVRSFLSVKGKGVNAGIQTTLRTAPSRFMAYNNGIVILVDEMHFDKTAEGTMGIAWLKGLQIVNGGQTTASIYFAKKRYPGDVDLSHVRVAAKIIRMNSQDAASEEALIADISRYANTQNTVRQSDLSANKPFHVEVEKLSLSVYCPDSVGRWFYERATGSYNTMLAREGTTPAKLRQLKEAIPASRKITKTDLAKFVVAWDQKPDIVSKGSQKNFDYFMSTLATPEAGEAPPKPSVADYKVMIAKARLFKDAQKLLRPMFQAFQANVTAYTVALVSYTLGNEIELERIWLKQSASPELLEQIGIWAREVNDVLHKTAGGRMVSEWAKKTECRDAVLAATYSKPSDNIPELRKK